MYISTEIGSLRKHYPSYEERLDLLKAAGFDAYDFSMFGSGMCDWIDDNDCAKKAKALRKYSDKIGMVCNQAHAPFALVIAGDEKKTEERFYQIVRALEIASILGARICVVHPWNNYSPEENAVIFKRLEPYAVKYGIKIALENMWNWNDKEYHAAPAACSDEENFSSHLVYSRTTHHIRA